ncbi:MAG: hypothetical protein WC196_07265 [Bacilli bacterium]|jgi:hypothetical protein|nr:hypothetical protein [Bacilli bacterium]MDD3422567.1 hypothetical protein [Bacilli bacterium]MDD4066317.1 hypothetical protein [Bacilli bacterium]
MSKTNKFNLIDIMFKVNRLSPRSRLIVAIIEAVLTVFFAWAAVGLLYHEVDLGSVIYVIVGIICLVAAIYLIITGIVMFVFGIIGACKGSPALGIITSVISLAGIVAGVLILIQNL